MPLIQKNDLNYSGLIRILSLCGASQMPASWQYRVAHQAWKESMKSANYSVSPQPFGGMFSVIADALGRTRRPAATVATGHDAATEGVTSRIGQWLMRRQMDGVAPTLARSQDVFDRLDRWMWRQHTRQIESYLAGSTDVFDLERRLKALERGQNAGLL
jgi:hypothetical protein